MFTIKKVLNSSVVLAADSREKEVIVLGKGIGYGKKPGTKVESCGDERVFIPLDNNDGNKLKEILAEIPVSYLEVCKDIVMFAQEVLACTLNDHIYLALTDHIYYAVQRKEQGINIVNKMFWNIQNLYPKEFRIGQYGLELIKQKIGVELPIEEAANVAFHIVNASKAPDSGYDALRVSRLIQSIVTTVTYTMKCNLNQQSIHYSRFISHLQFFAERMFRNEMLDEDQVLYNNMKDSYPAAMECAEKIRTLIIKDYDIVITDEEAAYLAVHIQRLSMRK